MHKTTRLYYKRTQRKIRYETAVRWSRLEFEIDFVAVLKMKIIFFYE